jgi:hypothetical protein
VVIPLPRRAADAGSAGSAVRSPGGWQVARVETTAMSADQFTAAVNALAALITEWNQRSTDSSQETRNAA